MLFHDHFFNIKIEIKEKIYKMEIKEKLDNINFYKLVIVNLIREVMKEKDSPYFYNLYNPIWKKYLAMFQYYHKEFIIERSIDIDKNIFKCYFMDPILTLKILQNKKNNNFDEVTFKKIIKDFKKLRNTDFQNISINRLQKIEEIDKNTQSGAFYTEIMIKKCIKTDYVAAYYYLINQNFIDYYNSIHKYLSKQFLKFKIKKLKEKIKSLENEKFLLEEHIIYMPEGDGYLSAKNNFTELKYNAKHQPISEQPSGN